jgi:UDP-N-acetylmuramoyl-tripeptide--D-alanyl-D-alanine ligase
VPGAPSAPALTADDLVRLTGARLLARSERPIRGGAVDSREVGPGSLFVALPGERTDGHAYLTDAVAAGAAALIVTRPPADPASLGDVTIVRVADGLAAPARSRGCGDGRAARRQGDGQHREDSTKEAVAAVLGQRFRTLRAGATRTTGSACR